MTRLPFDIEQARLFVCVAEAESLSKAATTLLLGQPALTKRIQGPEGTLGAKLLHRHGRGVTLTEAGRIVLRFCLGMVDQWEQLRTDLEKAGVSPRGELHFAVPPPLGAAFNADVVQAFSSRFREVRLRVSEASSYHIEEWLAAGKVDLGLVYSYAPPAGPHEIAVFTESLFLVGPGAAATEPSPMPLERALRLPLVMANRPSAMREYIEDAAGPSVAMNVVVEVDSLGTTRELVARGVGHSILPYSAVADDVASGRLTCAPIVGPALWRWLAATLPSQREVTPTLRALVAILRDQARRYFEAGKWKGRP